MAARPFFNVAYGDELTIRYRGLALERDRDPIVVRVTAWSEDTIEVTDGDSFWTIEAHEVLRGRVHVLTADVAAQEIILEGRRAS